MKIRALQVSFALVFVIAVGVAFASGEKKDLASEVEALKSQVAQLQKQIQNSQDYVDISNLETAYGYYVDKTKWDEVTDLFTDDGSVEIGLRGVYKGKERVRAYMHHLGDLKYGTLFNHSQLQPGLKTKLDP